MPETCKYLPTCVFYNGKMVNETGLADVLKKKYCETSNKNCARFMIAETIGREHLDNMIFPTMVVRAKELISEFQTGSV